MVESLRERDHKFNSVVVDRAYPGGKAFEFQVAVRKLGAKLVFDYKDRELEGQRYHPYGFIQVTGAWCLNVLFKVLWGAAGLGFRAAKNERDAAVIRTKKANDLTDTLRTKARNQADNKFKMTQDLYDQQVAERAKYILKNKGHMSPDGTQHCAPMSRWRAEPPPRFSVPLQLTRITAKQARPKLKSRSRSGTQRRSGRSRQAVNPPLRCQHPRAVRAKVVIKMGSTGTEGTIAAVLKWGFTVGTLTATTAAAVWPQKRAINAAVDLENIRSHHGVLVAKFAPIYEQTEPALTSDGPGMMDAHTETVTRFAHWLKQNEHRLPALDFEAIDSRYTPIPNVRTYVAEAEEIEMTFNALVYGINQRKAGRAIAVMGVSRFGIAGTGAKINDLSGGARESAILAFLGGGPVPKGGAGMQVEAIALKLWEGIVPTSTLALDGEISRYKSRRSRHAHERVPRKPLLFAHGAGLGRF
jgi:hypothetical protein